MNRSTRIKACVLSVVFTAVLLLAPFSPAQADSFPTYFNVNENNFYSAANIYVAYMELNQEQQDIANYLLGMYNLMYLGSRGFAFEQGAYSDESGFIAKIKSFGYRLFYNASGVALQSRMNEDFCKYASAVLLYASQCNVTFNDWFSNLDSDFIIPVDQGILNSFTLLYNDNSEIGIATYGDSVSPWESGIFLPFHYQGYNWWSGSDYNRYLSFITDHTPYVYTPVDSSSSGYQYLYEAKFAYPSNYSNTYDLDTLFILQGSNQCSGIYGNYSNLKTVSGARVYSIGVYYYMGVNSQSAGWVNYLRGTMTQNTGDLSDFIDYCFQLTPFTPRNYSGSFYYPYIQHVVLVDDLNSLSNPREIFNNSSWDVLGLSGDMITPIDTVNLKPKVLTTINLPDNTQSSVSIRDMINDDNVVDDQDQPTDPWQINVVVQPNDTNPISIDVNLFSSGSVYLDYLWEHTRKVVVFAKDVLDCFEFEDSGGDSYGPKFAIYGVLVLGVAGGMIAKFLL